MFKLFMKILIKLKPILIKILPISWLRKVKSFLILRRRKIVENYKKKPVDYEKFEFGVNLIGPIYGEIGLGESTRLVADALNSTGIPFTIYEYNQASAFKNNDKRWKYKVSKKTPYLINIIHLNSYELPLAFSTLGKKRFDGRYNIAFWLWELENFPQEWVFSKSLFHEIWTPAKFVSNSIKKSINLPVKTLPYALEIKTKKLKNREDFNLSNEDFIFLVMYDCNSTIERKNPLASIEAFKKTFAPEEKGVSLLLKVNNPDKKDLIILNNLIADYKNINIISKTMDKNDVNSLIACVDVFVSLHRAEGFGLVMAESMLLGTPVIATNWSANTEFMNEKNSCLLSYKLIKSKEKCGPYPKGSIWADPSVDEASVYMRKLYSNKEYYNKILLEAKKHMLINFSSISAGKVFKENLKVIKERIIESN